MFNKLSLEYLSTPFICISRGFSLSGLLQLLAAASSLTIEDLADIGGEDGTVTGAGAGAGVAAGAGAGGTVALLEAADELVTSLVTGTVVLIEEVPVIAGAVVLAVEVALSVPSSLVEVSEEAVVGATPVGTDGFEVVVAGEVVVAAAVALVLAVVLAEETLFANISRHTVELAGTGDD